MGIKGKSLSPHSLRHTTAVHLLQSGVDVNVIKAWLGHADVATTSRYLDIDMSHKRKALEKFMKALPPSFHNASYDLTEDKSLLRWLEEI